MIRTDGEERQYNALTHKTPIESPPLSLYNAKSIILTKINVNANIRIVIWKVNRNYKVTDVVLQLMNY